MKQRSLPVGPSELKFDIPPRYENTAWRWMRYSGVLLIPLVWFHVILQDVLVGVHRIDLDYVVQRWANVGWQVYDIALLGFAFAHGMNGLRQVLFDFFHKPATRTVIAWVLLISWAVITAIGAVAIVASAQKHLGGL